MRVSPWLDGSRSRIGAAAGCRPRRAAVCRSGCTRRADPCTPGGARRGRTLRTARPLRPPASRLISEGYEAARFPAVRAREQAATDSGPLLYYLNQAQGVAGPFVPVAPTVPGGRFLLGALLRVRCVRHVLTSSLITAHTSGPVGVTEPPHTSPVRRTPYTRSHRATSSGGGAGAWMRMPPSSRNRCTGSSSARSSAVRNAAARRLIGTTIPTLAREADSRTRLDRAALLCHVSHTEGGAR